MALASKDCVTDSNIKYRIGGVTPQWKSIGVYDTTDYGAIFSSNSDCTDDYFAFTADVFVENHPYVIVEDYVGAGECAVVETVTVLPADGVCYDSLDGLASFFVDLDPDLSASIISYNKAGCDGSNTSVSVASSLLGSHSCFEDNKKFFLGGLTTQWCAIVVHDSNDCTGVPVHR
ncbi:unnamed protein product [Phytophthora lilii]|uniref:Unnamed protein product n=1 Tax=Phytophthora lilii TaxID=2077276 RepID=A0A9W7CXD5_9STRA|nr:unnamed protein product [Phytophthora lilii]